MIHPLKYYTPQDLEDLGKEGFFPIREKITIIKLIETGQIPALNKGANPKFKQWSIKGEDILKFLDLRGTFPLQEEGKGLWNKDAKSKTTKTKKKSAAS